MLTNLSVWERKYKHFPQSLFSWKLIFGNDIDKFIGWFLTFTDKPIYEVQSKGRTYEFKHWGENEILCVDEFSQDEIRIPKSEAIELLFDEEAFAREISKAVGFERSIIEPLNGNCAYYLGTLSLNANYAVYVYFDFFKAEEYFASRLQEGRTPIVYCFSERNLTPKFRKLIEDARGKILLIKDCFELKSRTLKNLKPIEKIFAYRGKLRGEGDTHSTYKLPLPDISDRRWDNVYIDADGNEYVKIKYAQNPTYDIRFSDIEEFRKGIPPEYKPSALWEFFISTLFNEGVDFDSNENSADSKKRKVLSKILKRYFGIEKPPYRAVEGRLYPTFRVRDIKTSESPRIRFDKRRVSFNEDYHSL